MFRKLTTCLIPILFLFCSGAPRLSAQDVTAGITGVVKDATGGIVPDVAVTAVNTGTQARYQATSNAEGAYTFRALPVGVYNLEASAQGFKKFEAQGIRLQVNEISRVDMTLDVGAAAETVASSTGIAAE